MSGHSKWANIQHRKGRQDVARGKTFTKIAKEITVAAKMGGGDIGFNSRLRLAVDKAKNDNMPKDNIERAIKKGTGELEGVDYIEIRYEGYGPSGVAVIVEALTDNKNRTAASVRSIFSKSGGNLGETGAVGWMFNRKGVITVSAEGTNEDEVLEIALEAGAEDIKNDGDVFNIYTEFQDFEDVKTIIEESKLKIENSEITQIPENTIEVTDLSTATQLMNLYEKLQDDDDVQNVYANFDISDEIMDQLM